MNWTATEMTKYICQERVLLPSALTLKHIYQTVCQQKELIQEAKALSRITCLHTLLRDC